MMKWQALKEKVADHAAAVLVGLVEKQIAALVQDLMTELAAVRTDAQVEYRLRLEAEREKDNLASSNRALQQARDENSVLITKLRDRIFELEAHVHTEMRRCDLCGDLLAPVGPHVLDGVVLKIGPYHGHIGCLTRIVEGVMNARTAPAPALEPTPAFDVREHLNPDADAPTPD